MSDELKLDSRELQMKTLFDEQKKKITDLEAELKVERDLNAEIKARFVKCNTCTPDMKEKCPMFHENLCEGERCEELVDLMSLVEKRDHDDKLTEATEIIRRLMDIINHDLKCFDTIAGLDVKQKAERFLKEVSDD